MFVGKSSVPFERESDSGEWYKCDERHERRGGVVGVGGAGRENVHKTRREARVVSLEHKKKIKLENGLPQGGGTEKESARTTVCRKFPFIVVLLFLLDLFILLTMKCTDEERNRNDINV